MRKAMKVCAWLVLALAILCLASCGECEHEYSSWRTVKAATCLEAGTQSRTCAKCDVVETKTVNALGHKSVTDRAVSPTCTTAGKTEGSHCSVCGVILAAPKSIPAKGHTEVIDAAVAPTCSQTGKTQGKHCSTCHAVIVAQNTVAKKPHTEVVDKAVEATCISAGKTEGSHCSVCNTVIVAQQTVPKKSTHNYKNGTCSDCGAQDPNKVYGLGETWVVDGQWEFTVNSVTLHPLCNEYSNERNGYKNEQVVIINYTYKNLGYESTYSGGLYIFDLYFTVYDGTGESASTYACTHTKYPERIIKGMKCTATEEYVLNNKSSMITLVVKIGSHQAIFELPIK